MVARKGIEAGASKYTTVDERLKVGFLAGRLEEPFTQPNPGMKPGSGSARWIERCCSRHQLCHHDFFLVVVVIYSDSYGKVRGGKERKEHIATLQ